MRRGGSRLPRNRNGGSAKDLLAPLLRAWGDPNVFDVTMLGSTGTGKTTLLASMYERFDRVVGSTDLAVIPDYLTSVKLQEYIGILRNLPRTLQVEFGAWQGTGSIREYSLGVGRKGKHPLLTLRFTDYPGKYLIDADNAEKEKLQRALTRSDVILVAIDTSALMQRHGKYHDIVNTPMIVTDQIKRLLVEDTARLVILVPLKCERELSTPDGARQLTAKVVEVYEPLLNYMRSGAVRARVGCVLAPAQTVGSVVFSTVTEDSPGHPVFSYRSRSVGAAYQPIDTDQPLRYAMRFILNKYRMSERKLLRGIWELAFGADAALVAAVDQFAAGCKEDDSFKVLQTHEFLTPGG
jgi:hypothetical protein